MGRFFSVSLETNQLKIEMKTKEELAEIFANCVIENNDEYPNLQNKEIWEYLKSAVLHGFDLSEKFVNVEDELPKKDVSILLEYDSGIYLGALFDNADEPYFSEDSGQMNPNTDKPTGWRPIFRK